MGTRGTMRLGQSLEALLLLLVPMFLYIVSFLADSKTRTSLDQRDMRAIYFAHSRWMQGMLFLSLLSGSIATRVIEDRWNMGFGDALRISAMLVLLPGLVSNRPRVHAAQVFLLLILVLTLLRVSVPSDRAASRVRGANVVTRQTTGHGARDERDGRRPPESSPD